MSKHRIKPQFCLLRLDETEYWAEHIASRAKQIFGTYIFDQNKGVHLCEFTPSYECRFVGSTIGNTDLADDAAERLADNIREGDLATEPVRYFHCHEIDALPKIAEQDLKVGVTDLGIDNEDEAVEYVQQRIL
jgi:hypothetical protein